jgi:hypothetical protein
MRGLSGPPISPSDVLVRTDRHVSAPLGEALAMMDIDAGTYYLLDDVAATLWSALAAPTRVEDLVDDLLGRYDVDRARCESDVLPFLDALRKKGLLRVQA